MKMSDLRKQSVNELKETLAKTQKEFEKFKVDMRTKEVNNVRLGRSLRTRAARIKTIIREKELS